MHAEGVSDTDAVLEEDGGGLRERDGSPELLRDALKQNEADLDATPLRLPEGDLLVLATTEPERETLGDGEGVPEGGRREGDTEPVRDMEPPVELLRDADKPAEYDRDTDGLGEVDASAVGVTELLVTTVAEGLTKGAAVKLTDPDELAEGAALREVLMLLETCADALAHALVEGDALELCESLAATERDLEAPLVLDDVAVVEASGERDGKELMLAAAEGEKLALAEPPGVALPDDDLDADTVTDTLSVLIDLEGSGVALASAVTLAEGETVGAASDAVADSVTGAVPLSGTRVSVDVKDALNVLSAVSELDCDAVALALNEPEGDVLGEDDADADADTDLDNAGEVLGESDRSGLREELTETDALVECELERVTLGHPLLDPLAVDDCEARAERERVLDTVGDTDAEGERDPDTDTVEEGVADDDREGDVVVDAHGETLRERAGLLDIDGFADPVRDPEVVADTVLDDDTLSDKEGDAELDAAADARVERVGDTDKDATAAGVSEGRREAVALAATVLDAEPPTRDSVASSEIVDATLGLLRRVTEEVDIADIVAPGLADGVEDGVFGCVAVCVEVCVEVPVSVAEASADCDAEADEDSEPVTDEEVDADDDGSLLRLSDADVEGEREGRVDALALMDPEKDRTDDTLDRSLRDVVGVRETDAAAVGERDTSGLRVDEDVFEDSGERVADRCPVRDREGLGETVPKKVPVTDGAGTLDELNAALKLMLSDTLDDSLACAAPLRLTLDDALEHCDTDGEGEAVGQADEDPESEGDTDADGDLEGDLEIDVDKLVVALALEHVLALGTDALADCDDRLLAVRLCEALGVARTVALREGPGARVCEPERTPERDAEATTLPEGDDDADGLADAHRDADEQRLEERVAETEALTLELPLSDTVADDERVPEGDELGRVDADDPAVADRDLLGEEVVLELSVGEAVGVEHREADAQGVTLLDMLGVRDTLPLPLGDDEWDVEPDDASELLGELLTDTVSDGSSDTVAALVDTIADTVFDVNGDTDGRFVVARGVRDKVTATEAVFGTDGVRDSDVVTETVRDTDVRAVTTVLDTVEDGERDGRSDEDAHLLELTVRDVERVYVGDADRVWP